MAPAVTFTVHGTPAPAGSKRGFYNAKAKRVIVTDDSARSRPWNTPKGELNATKPDLLKLATVIPMESLQTRDCKQHGCTQEAEWTAGPFKDLCAEHAEPVRQRMRDSQRAAHGKRAGGVGSALNAARTSGSFEAKARTLVAQGKKLDRAVEVYKRKQESIQPARDAVAEAMREWKAACRALAGDEDNE